MKSKKRVSCSSYACLYLFHFLYMKHRILAAGIAAVTALGATTIALAQSRAFSDVPESFWARGAIEWAAANHIMTGPGGQNEIFAPGSLTNRAELAAVLMRLDQKHSAEIDMLRERILALEMAVHGDGWAGGEESSSSSSSTSRSSSLSSIMSSSSIVSSYSAFSSASVPAGAQAGKVILTAGLLGTAEVPPVDSNGRGTINMWWTEQGLYYDASVRSLSSAITGAHFHLGPPTETGEVLFPVTFDSNNRARGFWPDVSSETWTELTRSNVYFNVHTATHPDGEIRGQLLFRR